MMVWGVCWWVGRAKVQLSLLFCVQVLHFGGHNRGVLVDETSIDKIPSVLFLPRLYTMVCCPWALPPLDPHFMPSARIVSGAPVNAYR